jgi:hypothetical protein
MRWSQALALLTIPMLFGALSACAEDLPDHIDLLPAGQEVEFAVDTPSKDSFAMVGEVSGQAAANDPDTAEYAARNDMRNKAAALGATLVTIDDSIGEPLPLRDKIKVKVYGRAFKAVD